MSIQEESAVEKSKEASLPTLHSVFLSIACSSVSKDDIGSVKLLKMLKDSDDESVPVREPSSRLRRYRTHTYSHPTGYSRGLFTSFSLRERYASARLCPHAFCSLLKERSYLISIPCDANCQHDPFVFFLLTLLSPFHYLPPEDTHTPFIY